MAAIIDMDMPETCGECPLLKSGYGHCKLGKKIGSLNEKAKDCPLKSTDDMVAEISICKTENEMRIAQRDYKNKLLISGIFSEVMAIIHKYTKEQNNDKRKSTDHGIKDC